MIKPFRHEELVAKVRRIAEQRSVTLENRHLRRIVDSAAPRGMIASSRAMQAVLETVDRVASLPSHVLITGESGTGKDIVARAIHERGSRAQAPFVPINCAAIPEALLESELFGHVKGAFTDARTDRIGCFELADEGTLFLDEIANMPIRLQPKLLRVLQTGEVQKVGSSRVIFVNVRVISATNADLSAEIAAGRFREDLLYRLNTVVIHLPALRERRDDILPLAGHYLGRFSERYRRPLEGFDRSARQALDSHLWPGNVRELGHAIERAVLMAKGREITAADLGLQTPAGAQPASEEMSLDQAEKIFIQKVLARHGGDVRKAADQLGMSRSALYRRLQHFGL